MQEKITEVSNKQLDEGFIFYLGKMLETTTQEERQKVLDEFIEKYEPQFTSVKGEENGPI